MATLARSAPFSLLSFWNLQANEPIGHLKKLEKGSHTPVLVLRALCRAWACFQPPLVSSGSAQPYVETLGQHGLTGVTSPSQGIPPTV